MDACYLIKHPTMLCLANKQKQTDKKHERSSNLKLTEARLITFLFAVQIVASSCLCFFLLFRSLFSLSLIKTEAQQNQFTSSWSNDIERSGFSPLFSHSVRAGRWSGWMQPAVKWLSSSCCCYCCCCCCCCCLFLAENHFFSFVSHFIKLWIVFPEDFIKN